MGSICTPSSIEVRMNKCVMNAYGFRLEELYINGPNPTDDFSNLGSSTDNNCRGQLGYDNGPEYVFKIDRTLGDCGTAVGKDGVYATYNNAIQGYFGINNAVVSRKITTFIEFGCKFEVDLTLSTNIGTVTSTKIEVELDAGIGEFDVAMAVYEDSSFTKVAPSDYIAVVPEHVNVGIVGTDFDDTNYKIIIKNCWMTPDNDPNNQSKFYVIKDSCPNPDDLENINVIENGVSAQARFSFSAFQFHGQPISAQMYGHCAIHICDPNVETCVPDCSGRKRRDASTTRASTDTVVSFDIPIQGDDAKCKKNCNANGCNDICNEPMQRFSEDGQFDWWKMLG